MSTILLLDDDPEVLRFLQRILGDEGYGLLAASEGRQALELLRSTPVDLIITDIMMPKMNGYDFVHRVRADPVHRETPVIFHTAIHHEQDARALAQDCGVYELLAKPCRPETILRTVKKALGASPPMRGKVSTEFDRAHVQLLTNELSSKIADLEVVNRRLRLHSQELEQEVEERKRLEEQLRAWAARIESVREEERTRIAREIHDELGQGLTGLKMDVHWLKSRLANEKPSAGPAEIIARADSMSALIDETINTVRRIAAELRPGILDDLGLAAAIEWQIQDFEKRSGIRCMATTSESVELDREKSTAMFRILQEALTNIARHAGATEVFVSLRPQQDWQVLEVRDNGKGFDQGGNSSKASFGLMGMGERAALAGGGVEIRSAPGAGTKVIVRMPIGKSRASHVRRAQDRE